MGQVPGPSSVSVGHPSPIRHLSEQFGRQGWNATCCLESNCLHVSSQQRDGILRALEEARLDAPGNGALPLNVQEPFWFTQPGSPGCINQGTYRAGS
jgi:hypothetical protein